MFRWLLEKCSYEVLISIVSTLWAIWFVRNRKIFKGGSIDIKANVASFANVFHDYTSYAAKVFTSAKQLDSTTLNRWYRPNDGQIKLNVDANVGANGDRGLGVVARDSSCQLLMASVCRVKAFWTPELCELEAAVYGVELAIRMGYSHIILEGDNAIVFNGIGKQATGLAPSFVLFDKINTLTTFFGGFKCNLVGRNGNTTTHLVARRNLGLVGDFVYMSHFSQSLDTVVDLNLI